MKLDFEQRQEAERMLEQAIDEGVLRSFVYELVAARTNMQRMIDWLAKEDIEGDPDDLYSGRCHRVAAAEKILRHSDD